MTELHFTLDDPNEWVPKDFVSYFYKKCDSNYGRDSYDRNYDRDCPTMKHIMSTFLENSRTLLTVAHFIDWSFVRYEQKKLPPPMALGMLSCWATDFLQLPAKQKKLYNHVREVTLTSEQRKWVKAKRKAYKEGVSVYTPPAPPPDRKSRPKRKGAKPK